MPSVVFEDSNRNPLNGQDLLGAMLGGMSRRTGTYVTLPVNIAKLKAMTAFDSPGFIVRARGGVVAKRLTKNAMPRTMLGVLGPRQILVSDMVGAAGRSVMREVVTPDPHTGGRRLLPGPGGRAWVDAAPKAGSDRGQSRGRRCGAPSRRSPRT